MMDRISTGASKVWRAVFGVRWLWTPLLLRHRVTFHYAIHRGPVGKAVSSYNCSFPAQRTLFAQSIKAGREIVDVVNGILLEDYIDYVMNGKRAWRRLRRGNGGCRATRPEVLEQPPIGLEPMTCGLQNRCSTN